MTPAVVVLYTYLALALFVAGGVATTIHVARSCDCGKHREFIDVVDDTEDYLGIAHDGAFAVFIGLASPILLARVLKR